MGCFFQDTQTIPFTEYLILVDKVQMIQLRYRSVIRYIKYSH